MGEQEKPVSTVTSALVVFEARRGDPDAVIRRMTILDQLEILDVPPEASTLAQLYMKEFRMPLKAEADAIHLATAVLTGMDFLLTWNCRHLAKGSIIKALPVLNSRLKLPTPVICTPEELLYENLDSE